MVPEKMLAIGQRICVDDYHGTVKYFGPVPPTKGDWVGVEWDDPSRGKHNGTKDGVTYFTCDSETGGSFLRPMKICAGISICDALLQRYVSTDENENPEGLFVVDEQTNQKIKVETIGMDRVQKQFEDLNSLKVVGLRMQQISTAMRDGFVLKQASNIMDLDLSKNLLSDWEIVALICGQLKCLSQLNVSENLMKIPEQPHFLADKFISLKTIILNSCRLTWSDIISCLSMWPQIVELHLEKNAIIEIMRPSSDLFSKLKILNLSDNAISSWNQVLNLSQAPCLEQLILNNCSLQEIFLNKMDFQNLKQIYLSNNGFKNYVVFDELNKLQSLESLMFRNNPVLSEEDRDTMREIITAKIGNLKKLNKTNITELERQGSEMDYMRKYGSYWRESGGHQDPEQDKPSEKFLIDHPRYKNLIQVHGALDDAEFLLKSTALSSDLLEVNVEVPSLPEIKPFKKKLPSSMTVGAVKMLISRLTKIPIKELRLAYRSCQDPKLIVSMSKDAESLHLISLEYGDTIVVKPCYSDVPFRYKSRRLKK